MLNISILSVLLKAFIIVTNSNFRVDFLFLNDFLRNGVNSEELGY